MRTLRAQQFAEDAGPLAHNVRPDTYLEINNFYTATIYEKGAEIIRMLKVLIGDEAFRKGHGSLFRPLRRNGGDDRGFHRLFRRNVRRAT